MRRELDNVATQAYIIAIVMNLKKLMATRVIADAVLAARLRRSWTQWHQNETDTIEPKIHLDELGLWT